MNPCIGARLVRPGAANYNDLSVPDPATACGNLLYRARAAEKGRGAKGWMIEESLSDSFRIFVKERTSSQDSKLSPTDQWEPFRVLYSDSSRMFREKIRGKGMDD